MQIRDRVRELRRVTAKELRPNPRNWRTHPKAQQEVLRGLLAEVGYADALLARELEDGTLELIDGHLRAEVTPDMQVPVLVLDVNEEEAGKILATLDPLAAMATTDGAKLEELLRSISTSNPPSRGCSMSWRARRRPPWHGRWCRTRSPPHCPSPSRGLVTCGSCRVGR